MKFKLFARLKNENQLAKRTNTTNPRLKTNTQFNTIKTDTNILNEVSAMIQNGLSEAEIIQLLKEEGYDFEIIDNALNTVLKTTITGESASSTQTPLQSMPQNANIAQNQMFGSDFNQESSFENTTEDFSPQNAPTKNTEEITKNLKEIDDYNAQMEEIEETVTTLVNEKLGQITDIRKETENQFNSIAKEIELIKQQLAEEKIKDKTLETKELDEITNTAAKFNDIEPRIKALEKAFKDIIPNIIDNVRDIKERLNEQKNITNTDDYIKPKHTPKTHNKIENLNESKKNQDTINPEESKATEKDLFNI